MIKVETLLTPRGYHSYHLIIDVEHDGKYLIGYSKVIAFIPHSKFSSVLLDKQFYDYSRTTISFRNKFLGVNSKKVENMIANKEYKLVDLNNENYTNE